MRRNEILVFCVGLSHRTAPVALQRVSLSAEDLPAFLHLAAVDASLGLREAVALSTCNRVEVYGLQTEGTAVVAAVAKLLAERAGLEPRALEPHLYEMSGRQAAHHLYRVASGLDSLVLGEAQVLGQVATAYSVSQRLGMAGPVISAVFQGAIRAGRRVRRETAIGKSAASISSAAIRLAEEHAGGFDDARVLVVGTGEMGRLALRSLRERGALRIDVVNRRFDRAAAVARRWGAKAHLFNNLPCLIETADVVISSTSAPSPIISADMVENAMRERGGKPMVIVDLAVPRDIDPDVSAIPGVRLLDLDSLRGVDDKAQAEQAKVYEQAMKLIEEELSALELRMAELTLNPVLAELWLRADGIRKEVLEHTRARVPNMDDDSWAHIEALAQALVKKLFHAPAVRLRAEASNGHAESFAEAITVLFGLPGDGRDRPS